MTTQTDERNVALSSPTGKRSVLRYEAAGGPPQAPSAVSSGGELLRSDAVAPHPPTPAADRYAKGVDWPVMLQGNDVLLVCGQRVDIITMGSGLAGEVNNSLKLLGLNAAVLEVVGETRRWAFFCQSQPPSITNLGILYLRGVNHYSAGSLFLLPPSPESDTESLRWIAPPVPGMSNLPLIGTITSCAQTALQI